MAHRDHQYHLAMPNLEGGESSSEDGEDGFDRPPGLVDMDSPDDFDGDEDAFFNDRESIRPSSEDGLDEDNDDDEDGNSTNGELEDVEDDGLTWDTVSEGSGRSAPAAATGEDQWFPLTWRREAFPNFLLPTTTRSAIPVPQDFAPPTNTIPVVTSHPSTSHAAPSHAPNIAPNPPPPFLFTSKTMVHTQQPQQQPPVRPASPGGASDESETDEGDYNHYVGVMRPEPSRSELAKTILDYFLHHGHAEVVETFCKEMGLALPEKEIREMNERNEVRDLIWAGDMEKAIERIPPKLLEDEDVQFAVRKQHIIEMIRVEKTQEPVEYFRKHLMKNGKRPDDERMDIIEKIFTLMVYADSSSQFQTFMGQPEREATAKIVNSALLGHAGKSRSSNIDLLAKTIAWSQNEVALKQRPGSGSTTQAWADHLFAEPMAMNDFVNTAIKVCPLDQTEDLC